MLPQETVAMQHIGRDDNNRSGSNRLASESILAESNPADGGDGRIEATTARVNTSRSNRAVSGSPFQLAVGLCLHSSTADSKN